MWKPLFWRPYWEYADQESFLLTYPQWHQVLEHPPPRRHCVDGDFLYHFEDAFYYYRLTTQKSKRRLVFRFPKGYESMGNTKLFEKTPSEKGYQRRET
jgi:hypothetical protein